MGKTFTKDRNFKFICQKCGNENFSGDVKTYICSTCKEKILTKCSCGCGKEFSRERWRINAGQTFWYSHERKGKTYQEIYKTTTPKCGFQHGEDNIAKRPEIREKIRASVKKSYTPALKKLRSDFYFSPNGNHKVNIRTGSFSKRYKKYGRVFYSKLEVDFADLLEENNIPYETQIIIPLCNSKRKIVDFKIGKVLVEVSGFAHKKWRDDFIEKMKILRQSTSDSILILTYPKNSHLIYSAICGHDMSCDHLDNKTRIIKTIKFMQWIQKTKEMSIC